MNGSQTHTGEMAGLSNMLEERRRLFEDQLLWEREALEQSYTEMAERTQWWEGMITELRVSANAQQLSSYRSLAGSMSNLLGGSIRQQAKLMVPFEIAESTKEFARFLGTKDPSALASSLKHALAARQYAAAAKSSAGGSASVGGAASGAPAATAAQGEEKPSRQARVIVNVDRQVGVVDTYEFARTLIDAINENVSDDVVLEVAS